MAGLSARWTIPEIPNAEREAHLTLPEKTLVVVKWWYSRAPLKGCVDITVSSVRRNLIDHVQVDLDGVKLQQALNCMDGIQDFDMAIAALQTIRGIFALEPQLPQELKRQEAKLPFERLGGAEFNENRRCRYKLWRILSDRAGGDCVFIGLNPSLADEDREDPTVKRMMRYARDWGCVRMFVTNVVPLITPYPERLKKNEWTQSDIENNVRAIIDVSMNAKHVICCWGNHGSMRKVKPTRMHIEQALLMRGVTLSCLSINKGGQPKHPLYCKASLKPLLYKAPAVEEM
jgi:hypothetical protein